MLNKLDWTKTPVSPVEKIWGTTEPIVLSPLFEMHRLVVKPRHRCSLHMHHFKHNVFYVLSGTLFVDVHNERVMDPKLEEYMLIAGDSLAVPPGHRHQFRTGEEAASAIECYFTEPLSEDITRDNTGGPCT